MSEEIKEELLSEEIEEVEDSEEEISRGAPGA